MSHGQGSHRPLLRAPLPSRKRLSQTGDSSCRSACMPMSRGLNVRLSAVAVPLCSLGSRVELNALGLAFDFRYCSSLEGPTLSSVTSKDRRFCLLQMQIIEDLQAARRYRSWKHGFYYCPWMQ